MSTYDLFYLFLERSNFDVERMIFFLLIKLWKKKEKQKKRKTEELVLACKVQQQKSNRPQTHPELWC